MTRAASMQLDPMLATKLLVPRPRALLVPRAHLIQQLEQGVERSLTLVSAPAAAGKSTLLSQWVREGKTPAVWISLEPADNEPARFLAYLIAALQQLYPRVGTAALGLLRAPLAAPPESILASLINDLAGGATERFLLVLDDYHVISSERIHHIVRFLVEHLPTQMHLVLATRTDPPLPLARLRARDQLTDLRGSELRFTPDEAAAFLTRVMGLPLSAADITALAARTEGWVGGLQLAALSLRGQDDLSASIGALTGSSRYILDYLVEEVLSRQREQVQRFLLDTSCLDRLCGPLCDALTGARDGQATLEQLEADNLFVIPLDQRRTWYRYHQLFAEVLRARLQQTQPERLQSLHGAASRWYETAGMLAEAISHALAGQEYDAAARLIEQVAGTMFWERGELQTLQEWLGALPDAVLRSRPLLCLYAAWLRLWTGHLDDVEPLLGVVLAEQSQEGAASPISAPSGTDAELISARLGEVAAIRAELARLQNDIPTAMTRAREARQALAALPETRHHMNARAVSLGILAAVYRAGGAITMATEAYDEACRALQASGQIVPALVAIGYLVQLQAEAGRLHLAESTHRRATRWATERQAEKLPAMGVVAIGMGEVAREWNDVAAAERYVRSGIDLCRQWEGLSDDTVDGYRALARVSLAQGDADTALEVLATAEELAERHLLQKSGALVAATRAWVQVRTGDLTTAAEWAESQGHELSSAADDDLTSERQEQLTVLAWVLLAQGRSAEATGLLERVLRAAEASGANGRVIEALALEALALQAQAQTAQAIIALSRALVLAEPEGYVRVFLDAGAPMAGLLREAQARQVVPDYAGKLLAAFGQATASALSPAILGAEALIDPLSAREIELLRLIAAGLSPGEAADQLVITVGTVRNHLKRIYGKLGAHSRLQAVDRARALHLL